ncbi:MAG: hypothetical protein IJV99_01440 [Clostridia bacterium]|nr:hypothetical protein [Clostridia bacterium]
MKTFSKKLTAIVMLAILSFSAFIIGFATLYRAPAIAESKPFTVTNLEDLIDAPTDIYWRLNRSNMYDVVNSKATPLYDNTKTFYSGNRQNGNLDELNTYYVSDNVMGGYYQVNWGMFTTAGSESQSQEFSYPVYGKGSGANGAYAETKSFQYNVNDYAGNLSFFSTESVENTVWFVNTNTNTPKVDRNRVVSFRVNYEKPMHLIARSKDIASAVYGQDMKGYCIVLSGSAASVYTSSSKGTLLTTYNFTNLAKGDDLTITYGAYDVYDTDGTTVTGTNVYLDIYNNTKQAYVVENKTYEGAADANSNAANYMGVVIMYQSYGWLNSTKEAVSFGGINEPLLASYNTELTVKVDVNKQKTLADIDLPAGYSFKNSSQETANGVKVYDGVISFDYYGNATKDCKITVIGVTNLEDITDDASDIFLSMESIPYLDNTPNKLHTQDVDGVDVVWGKFTTKGDGSTTTVTYPKVAGDGYLYGDYTMTTNEDGTLSSTIPYNANDYDGNVSVFTAQKANRSSAINFDVNDANTILSFKMNYEKNRRVLIYARADKSDTTMLRSASQPIYYIYLDYSAISLYFKGASISGTSRKFADLLSVAKVKYPDAGLTELLTDGEVMTITYGMYDIVEGAETKTYFYFNVVNEDGYVVIDENYDVTAQEKTVNTARENNFMGVQTMLGGGPYYQSSLLPITFGGANAPLFVNATVEGGLPGQKGSDIISILPEGYVLTDEAMNTTLAVGENTLSAVWTGEYYGNDSATSPATLTVIVEGVQVTIKDMNGGEISSQTAGGEFVLPTLERAKTFLAYKVGDTLYKQGEKVTLTGDTIVTLYEIDMKVEEKVSVRLANSENGFGGLRFTAKILTSDLTVLTAAGFEVATAIVPLDLIEDASMVRYGELSDTEIVEDYTVAYFTITDLNYHNYNREYAGRVAVKVGSEYVYSATVSESAYTAALAAYGEDTAALINTGEGLYSAANLAILEEYVFGVIDLTYTVDGDQATVKYTDENGLGESWFGLKGVTSATVEENILTVTAEIEVGAKAADLVADGNAPVIVRNSTNVSAYKPATIDARSVQDGVLTITFRVKLA